MAFFRKRMVSGIFRQFPGAYLKKIRKMFQKSVDKCVYVVYILIYTDYARKEYTER